MKWAVSNILAKVAQSCQILCDPMDYTVHGILQATILEWVAIPFSRGLTQVSTLQADSLPDEPQGKPSIRDNPKAILQYLDISCSHVCCSHVCCYVKHLI